MITIGGIKRRIIAIFAVFVLMLSSMPVFAQESGAKFNPSLFFNFLNDRLANLGQKSDGTSVMEFKGFDKSTLTPAEIRERRQEIGGGKRGMAAYE